MKKIFFLSVALVTATVFIGCNNDDDPVIFTNNLTISLSGLESLGDDFIYEGWLITADGPVTAGTFAITADGNLLQNGIQLSSSIVESATSYVVTIEPYPDTDPAPSNTHILAGDFDGNTAALTVSHPSALNIDLTTATGSYILATPTDGPDTNENSGVWWLDPSGAEPVETLVLEELPEGWKYEGWAVIDGKTISTGTFTQINTADDSAVYSETIAPGPPFPGEDFLKDAPEDVTFPTDLAGAVVVISVEPYPDNSAAPFVLKPLLGNVPEDAGDHMLYDMFNNAAATNPIGTVIR